MKIISVITATYNSSHTIQKLIESFRKTKNNNIEWIIIDGASTDNTISILNNASDVIDKVISEPDEGIYDAWNKGLKICTGEYYSFIGSDEYISNEYFNIALSSIDGIHNVIGFKIQLFDNNFMKNILHSKKWIKPWNYPINVGFHHQGTLFHKDLFKDNTFNNKYKIFGDAEFYLHVSSLLRPLIIITEKPLLYFSIEGISSKTENILIKYKERLHMLYSVRNKYILAYYTILSIYIKYIIRYILLMLKK